MSKQLRIAIFAHNEEESIESAILSVLDSTPTHWDRKVFVLINGSKDRTSQVVRNVQSIHPEVVPVELSFGDKCNAWNEYVYKYADDSFCHFFMDGDVRCSPQAIPLMYEALENHHEATAIGGVPLSGRNKQKYLKYMKRWNWIYGNLYAVKSSHLAKLKDANIKIPIGLMGNDNMITKFMAYCPSEPESLNFKQIIHCSNAGYVFDSLKPYRLRDIKIYFKRLSRYTLRTLQLEKLFHHSLDNMPRTMDDINLQILQELTGKILPFWDRKHAVRRILKAMYGVDNRKYYETIQIS